MAKHNLPAVTKDSPSNPTKPRRKSRRSLISKGRQTRLIASMFGESRKISKNASSAINVMVQTYIDRVSRTASRLAGKAKTIDRTITLGALREELPTDMFAELMTEQSERAHD